MEDRIRRAVMPLDEEQSARLQTGEVFMYGHELTPTVLAYLFSDKLVPQGSKVIGRFSDAAKVPCKDVRVNISERAALLFASAFWNLREQGLVKLEIFRTKSMFVFSHTRVAVEKAGDAHRPGLEGAILQNMTGRPGDNVREIIRRWYGKDVINSAAWLVGQVEREVRDLGFFSPRDGDHDESQTMKIDGTKYRPDCEKIAAVEPQADDFVARFQTFQQAEPELSGALLKQCRAGISSRNYSESTS